MNQRLRVREAGSHWNDHLDSDECEAKTYARKRYTESQSSIYARSSGSEVVSNAHWLNSSNDDKASYPTVSELGSQDRQLRLQPITRAS